MEEKVPRKNLKRRIIILAAVLILLAAYASCTPRTSDITTYFPFTGRIFDIEPGEIVSAHLMNGGTLTVEEHGPGDELDALVDTRNSIRYYVWISKVWGSRGGWTYRVTLTADDGTEYDYTFGDNWIDANNVVYFLKGKGLSAYTIR